MDWSHLGLAGALLVGMLFGSVLTLRIIRIAIEWLRDERKKSDT